MGKVKQRNWLIILTVFLVIVSSVGVILSIRENISFNSCAFEGEIYKNGELVPGYNNSSSCFCNSDGSIKCENASSQLNYTEFSSKDLKFSYDYVNSLSNENFSSSEEVNPLKASLIGSTLTVAFERNAMCSVDATAPVQSGFYILNNEELRLTVITNLDTSKYTEPCKIENQFVISNVNVDLTDHFQVYYQSSDGTLSNLGACVYEGTIHGDQEVFKSSTSKSVCLCDYGVVTCKQL